MSQVRATAGGLAENKMVLEFGTSGTAVCAATFATNPIDVVKVRVQLANSTGVTPGLVGTASSILRNEGTTPSCTAYDWQYRSSKQRYHLKAFVVLRDANLLIVWAWSLGLVELCSRSVVVHMNDKQPRLRRWRVYSEKESKLC